MFSFLLVGLGLSAVSTGTSLATQHFSFQYFRHFSFADVIICICNYLTLPCQPCLPSSFPPSPPHSPLPPHPHRVSAGGGGEGERGGVWPGVRAAVLVEPGTGGVAGQGRAGQRVQQPGLDGTPPYLPRGRTHIGVYLIPWLKLAAARSVEAVLCPDGGVSLVEAVRAAPWHSGCGAGTHAALSLGQIPPARERSAILLSVFFLLLLWCDVRHSASWQSDGVGPPGLERSVVRRPRCVCVSPRHYRGVKCRPPAGDATGPLSQCR